VSLLRSTIVSHVIGVSHRGFALGITRSSPQVPRRGPRQPPQRHVAHCHHLPERRVWRHRPQHLLRQGYRCQHRDHGKYRLLLGNGYLSNCYF
jgi:hypothetical protein